MKAAPVACAAAAATALAVAGCGASAAPPSLSRSSPTFSSPSQSVASVNEHAFMSALTSASASVPPTLVSGPVMAAYITFDQELKAAEAASGTASYPPSTLSGSTGSYQLCSPVGGGCYTYNAFTTNAAGQITGMSVNGHPIAGRIATGTSSTGQLRLSSVVAYPLTPEFVGVCFKLTDSSYQSSGHPPVLPAFRTRTGQFAANSQYTQLLPSALSPGLTAYGCAVFDTTAVIGMLSLNTNDQAQMPITSSKLSQAI